MFVYESMSPFIVFGKRGKVKVVGSQFAMSFRKSRKFAGSSLTFRYLSTLSSYAGSSGSGFSEMIR